MQAVGTVVLAAGVVGGGYWLIRSMAQEQGLRAANANVSNELKNGPVLHNPPPSRPSNKEIPGGSHVINPAWSGDGSVRPVKGGGEIVNVPVTPGEGSAIGPPHRVEPKPKPAGTQTPQTLFSNIKTYLEPPVKRKGTLRRNTTRRANRKPISSAAKKLFRRF